jgi:hypothetical protein
VNGYLVAAGLVLLVIAIFRGVSRRARDTERPAGSVPPEIDAGDVAAAALAELELDRRMGKLTESDYQELRARYGRPVAAGSERAGSPRPDAEPPAGPEERAEELVRQASRRRLECPECGPRPEPDSRFCSRCGRFLIPCPGCGAVVVERSPRHCSTCGHRLV